MKKIFFTLVLCWSAVLSVLAQNNNNDLSQTNRDFLYINTFIETKNQVNALSRDFSVDGCVPDSRTGLYTVRIFLARHEYDRFLALNLPYEIIPVPEERPGMVATSLTEMADWDKYPSYEVYEQLMQNFQQNFPDLCKIDTILAATPCTSRPHKILAAHISNTLGQAADKPAFLYSSTMHGDEVVGYYMMIRLIDYILNNATTDAQVQNILQNVELYICPLENPDGTYRNSNTQISSYASSRYNWNNVDMNRNYPFLPGVNGEANVQPETQAIINWVADKHFVMSANFHGGAELTNYPWDSWDSDTRSHADDTWFQYICQNYVNTCQIQDPTYMVGETAYNPGCGPVTEGGDWYVITGSRQDYMNYYQHCREVTMEVHFDKVVTSSSELPTYWTNSKDALLDYIMECTYGFRGIVTDAVTGEPVEAKIFVQNHDTFQSEVYSHLPLGTYYRPIKAGVYTVEVSADCYETQTFTITTTDGAGIRHDVQLQPSAPTPQVEDQHINFGESATLTATSSNTINWYASATDTIALATGNTFTTPTLTDTAIYYVEEVSVNNDLICVSERSSVTVFVIVSPDDVLYSELSAENCDSYTYEEQTFTTSGDYEFLYPNGGNDNVDSILVLHLTIHPSYDTTMNIQLDLGEHYMMGDYDFYSNDNDFYQFDMELETVFGCDSLVHYNITVGTGPTGLTEGQFSSVTLYPNPTTNVCHLTGLAAGDRAYIRIFNAMGQLISDFYTDKENVLIDLQEMKSGLYSIHVSQNGEKLIRKIIKL